METYGVEVVSILILTVSISGGRGFCLIFFGGFFFVDILGLLCRVGHT